MSVLSSFFAVISSAVLLSLGIPNEYLHFGSAFFGIISLIPLYVAFYNAPTRKRFAWLYGAMIASVHLFSSFWLAYFENFAVFTLGASTVAYFALGTLFGVWFYYAMKLPIRLRPFAFAGLWTVWEWFKGSGFVAYPWGSLSMSALSLRTFVQIADITGIWGITALIALTSALLAEIILAATGLSIGFSKQHGRPLYRPLIFTAALLLCVNGYGIFRLYEKREPQQTLTLAIVQQNTDPWVFGIDQFFTNLYRTQQLTEQAIASAPVKPDLIVWNESSLAYGYDQFKDYYHRLPFEESFTDFLQRMDIPLLTGSPLLRNEEKGSYSNAVYLINPDGSVQDTYSKIQLICFAEYIPFVDHPLVQRFFSSLVGFSSGWEPGDVYKTVPLTTQNGKIVRFAAPICFEDAFPALCADLHNQRSNILINLTNDSWSKTASAEYQHFAVAYFRAIELRTPLVRATNGGYTCVIDPTGAMLASLPLFTAASISVSVPIYPYQQTLYAQWKDWFPALMLCIGIVAMIIYRRSTSFCKKAAVFMANPLEHLDAKVQKQLQEKRRLKKTWVRKHLKQYHNHQ